MLYWKALLSDGTYVNEEWILDELSPWQRLMVRCIRDKTYVVSLTLLIDGTDSFVTIGKGARGFWQANGRVGIQGSPEEVEAKGIGCVYDGVVNIVWCSVKNGSSNWWQEIRPIEGQNQIIWAPS